MIHFKYFLNLGFTLERIIQINCSFGLVILKMIKKQLMQAFKVNKINIRLQNKS